MRYIVELGRSDGYVFDEEETYNFLETEKDQAMAKYESMVVDTYKYKALYEEDEKGTKRTVQFAICKLPSFEERVRMRAIAYFISYTFVTNDGTRGFANGCFDIVGGVKGIEQIRELEIKCDKQHNATCTIISYQKVNDDKEARV